MLTHEQAIELLANSSVEEINLDDLITILQLADDQYYNDETPLITDSQYDQYRRYAKQQDPTNPYFASVGSSVRGAKIPLPYQMGSLDQRYEDDIVDWIKTNNITGDLVISDKLDGASVLLTYHDGNWSKAYSRGDGITGQDITELVDCLEFPRQIDSRIKAIRCELIISTTNWPIFQSKYLTKNKQKFKNARNCVAGLINAINPPPSNVCKYIDIVAYEIVDYI